MPRRSSPVSGKGVLCTGLTEPASSDSTPLPPTAALPFRFCGSPCSDSGSVFLRRGFKLRSGLPRWSLAPIPNVPPTHDGDGRGPLPGRGTALNGFGSFGPFSQNPSYSEPSQYSLSCGRGGPLDYHSRLYLRYPPPRTAGTVISPGPWNPPKRFSSTSAFY